MSTNANREGDANDLLYTEEAAAVLGITLETFKVGRACDAYPLAMAKIGARLMFRRGDLWAWLDDRAAARTRVPCGIPGCRHQGRARTGYCAEHAKRLAVRGTAVGMGPIPTRPRGMTTEDRFASYLEPDPLTGCLIWCGSDTGDSGYGKFTLNGKTERAHRAAFYLANGRMPAEELDHGCGNRACVRLAADHVVEVSKATNMALMFERLNARRTSNVVLTSLPEAA